MFRILVAFLAASVIVPSPTMAEEQRWYDYEPATATLKGFLAVKYYYGPPGFGETPKTDYKVQAWLLLLSTPINIRGAPDPDDGGEATNILQIDLVPPFGKHEKTVRNDFIRFRGREVIVTGSLYEGRTGWYWVNTAMQVKTISLAPRGNDRD
ncbi:MAG: hypothetical protein U0527_05855 [Candidatus Eisenbacteria bacterium]